MITISAGHFGKGTGANGFLDEGAENIRVVKRLGEILSSSNIPNKTIFDTINKSKDANVNWLVTQHNLTHGGIDVQVHFNSSGGSHNRGIGVEVLVKSNLTAKGARAISKAISDASGLRDRGVELRPELGFLRLTRKPAYLIEVCFVNDSVDSAIYRRDFEKICKAIATELAKLVGRTLTPKPVAPKVSQKIEFNEKNGNKVWRIQSGKYSTKESAIEAAKKTGLSYVTIVGYEQ